jgi:hypothetical protein
MINVKHIKSYSKEHDKVTKTHTFRLELGKKKQTQFYSIYKEYTFDPEPDSTGGENQKKKKE